MLSTKLMDETKITFSLVKSRNIKKIQEKSFQMNEENKLAEKRINFLKEKMEKQKHERLKMGTTIWQSSKIVPKKSLHICNPIGMLQSHSNKPLDKKPFKSITSKTDYCELCKLKAKKVNCNECIKGYCSMCFKSRHSKGTLRKHNWDVLEEQFSKSGSMNLTLSTNNIAFGTTKDQQLEAVSKNSLSDLILNGSYDKESSAQSFTKALKEWRSSKSLTRNENASATHKSTATGTSDYIDEHKLESKCVVNVSFTSSLSYLDRITVKMGKRNSSVIPSTRFYETDAREKCLTPSIKEESLFLSFVCAPIETLLQDETEIDIKSCGEDDEEVVEFQNKQPNKSEMHSVVEAERFDHSWVVEKFKNESLIKVNKLKSLDTSEIFLLSTNSAVPLWRPLPIYKGLGNYYLLGVQTSNIPNQTKIMSADYVKTTKREEKIFLNFAPDSIAACKYKTFWKRDMSYSES